MYSKPTRFGNATIGGSAARRLAVDSLQNIANLHAGSTVPPDFDVSKVEEVLKGVAEPMPIVDVAQRLDWDSARTADALTRGGESGLLEFSRSGDTTSVKLAE